jgi:hypothetical protein
MRKKVVLFAMLGAVSFGSYAVTMDQLSDVSFVRYRILSQGPGMMGASSGSATYVIATNPPLAISLGSAGPETVRRIASGSLRNCYKLGEGEKATMQKAALSLTQKITGLNTAVEMGGVQVSNEQAGLLEGAKNFIAYINESVELPMYMCELQPVAKK